MNCRNESGISKSDFKKTNDGQVEESVPQVPVAGKNTQTPNNVQKRRSAFQISRHAPPWGRCLPGAVDVRWVVVVASSSPRIGSSRALGSTVTLLRSNGDASMGLHDGAMR